MLTICCTGIFTVWVHAELLQLCQTVCDPMDCSLPDSSVHGDSPGKNTGVGCHALLQGIFSMQEMNLCLVCLLPRQVVFCFFVFTTSTT